MDIVLDFKKHGFYSKEDSWIKLVSISETEQGMLIVNRENDTPDTVYNIDHDDCRGRIIPKYSGKIRSQLFLDTLMEELDIPS